MVCCIILIFLRVLPNSERYTYLALHTGKAFIYVSNIDGVKVDDRWKLHTILDSPVQLMGHGFGYTVSIYDTFAVVGTTASTGNPLRCFLPYQVD